LRHGILLGSQEFLERIRRGYLTAAVDGELPQQRAVAKSVRVEHLARQAAEEFGWGRRRLRLVGESVESASWNGIW
jgi:hypothetical protein